MKTYNDVYIEARRRLREAGVAMSDLEARLIISYASGKSQAEFLRDARQYADGGFTQSVMELIARRENGEPVAYIAGEWEFYGLTVTISPDVLIPRSDTEILAGAAINILKACGGSKRALDLCAGSGCVGLAIAANVPGCSVVLADLLPGALKICRTNILRNGLMHSVTEACADAREVPPEAFGTFGVIACNPPYIPAAELETLDCSVRDFEPLAALDGGADGLEFYRDISDKWRAALSPGGTLLFECGASQAGDVRAIMEANGFSDITIISDTQGIERVVHGTIGGL